MSRLDIMTPSHAQTVIDGLYRDVERRIAASPPGLCPVDLAKSFLDLCHAQTCGKCVPCRIGLGQLSELMELVLEGKATMETISVIERLAHVSSTAPTAPSAATRRDWCSTVYRASATIMRNIFCATAVSAACARAFPAWRCVPRAWIFRATLC